MIHKVNLLSIEISSFQSIAESQQLDFSEAGIYTILGRNIDEGGSNGAGKSSLVRAITCAILGPSYLSLNNSDLKNRKILINPQLKVKFLINDKVLFIERNIGGKINAFYDNEPIIGSQTEIQKKIFEILKISPVHYLFLTHKMQESTKSFLLLKDSERKEFLGDFFQINKIQDIYNKNLEKIKEIEAQINKKQSEIENLNKILSLLQDEENELLKEKSEFNYDNLKALENERDVILKKLESEDFNNLDLAIKTDEKIAYLINKQMILKQQYEDLYNDYLKNKKTKESELSEISLKLINLNKEKKEKMNEILEIDKKIKGMQEEKLTLNFYNLEKNKYEKELLLKKQDVEKIHQLVCYACKQTISHEKKEEMSLNIVNEINALQKKIDVLNKNTEEILNKNLDEHILHFNKEKVRLENALKELDKLNYQELLAQKSKIERDIIDLENNFNKIKQEQNDIDLAIKERTDAITSSWNEKRNTLQLSLKNINNSIKVYKERLDNIEEKIIKNKERQQQYQKDICKLEEMMLQLNKQLKIKMTIKNLTSKNGLMGYLFDTILNVLNEKVAENIKMLPLISKFNLKFVSDKIVKATGDNNKVIDFELFDNNGNLISFNSLSGAERQSIMLAVDVALDELISERLGIDINYKILDEQLGFIDAEYKEAILEFLNNKYKNKVLLLIDHGSELNTAIAKRIIVQKEYGISTILREAQ